MAANVATADMLISSPMLGEEWTSRPEITPRAWDGSSPVA
jgi:methylglyoxal synthase